jgi:trehalose 2-sulfotransferase
MYTHHKFDHEFPYDTPTRVSYMVCSVPRCGSSMLCELLCNTEVAGAPTEFFDQEQVNGFCDRWGVATFADYVGELLARKTGPNGVFGIKVHWGQLESTLGAADPAGLFPGLRYVHMRREDRLRQAVSWVRALQTNQWASTHDVRGEPAFDRAEIARYLRQIEDEEDRWEEFFARHGIAPHQVVYEQLVKAPHDTVDDVLRYLGVTRPQSADRGELTLEAQADLLTERWVEQYRAGATSRNRPSGSRGSP